MSRNFNEWFSKFKSSISNYSYYVNFDKIYEQADKYKAKGSKNQELTVQEGVSHHLH